MEHANVIMMFPDTEEIQYVLCAAKEELKSKNKHSDEHVFKGHDDYAGYYNNVCGYVIACEEAKVDPCGRTAWESLQDCQEEGRQEENERQESEVC